MSDEDLHGLDEPRALPAAVRARLEAALERIASDDDDPGLQRIDTPRPVPERTRVHLEGALSVAAREVIDGLDEPRAIPPGARARIESALTRPAPRRAPSTWLVRSVAVAASVVLVAASALALSRAGNPSRPDIPFAGPVSGGSESDAISDGVTIDDGTTVDLGAIPQPGTSSVSRGDAAAAGSAGPPPPFAYLTSLGSAPASPLFAAPDASTGSHAPSAATPSPTPRAPLLLAVARGGGAQDEGFFAYLSLLNRQGGVRHRQIEVVDVADARASRAVATVNLQDFLLGSSPVTPVLESIAAPEIVLDGAVVGFASPPERQASLIANHIFPDDAPGATAVVYHTDEDGFGDRIPEAIERVLRNRDVTVLRVPFDPDRDVVLVPGDAAFLSMRTGHARAWLAQARTEGYRPTRGVAGIYTLADPALLSDLPEGARFVSPYTFPRGDERTAIQRETAEPLSADLVHGWVSAKAVAVAVWLSDADSSSALTKALTGSLTGWQNGFAPPYETRAGSRARTPEGLVYRVEDSRFVADTGFLRDRS